MKHYLRVLWVVCCSLISVATFAIADFRSPDMRKEGLRGKVLKVVTTTIPCDEYYRQKGDAQSEEKNYPANGILYKGNDVKRNVQGYVLNYKDEFTGYDMGYECTYDMNGQLVELDGYFSCTWSAEYVDYGYSYTLFEYNHEGYCVKSVSNSDIGAMPFVQVVTYEYLEFDKYGNWTARRTRSVMYDSTVDEEYRDYDYTYFLETRQITYDVLSTADIYAKLKAWSGTLPLNSADYMELSDDSLYLYYDYYLTKNMSSVYYDTDDAITGAIGLNEDGDVTLYVLYTGDIRDVTADVDIWGSNCTLDDDGIVYKNFTKAKATDAAVKAGVEEMRNKIKRWRERHAYYLYTTSEIANKMAWMKEQMLPEANVTELTEDRVLHITYYLAKNIVSRYYSTPEMVSALVALSPDGRYIFTLYANQGKEQTEQMIADHTFWADTLHVNNKGQVNYLALSREEATDSVLTVSLHNLQQKLNGWREAHSFYRYTAQDISLKMTMLQETIPAQIADKKAVLDNSRLSFWLYPTKRKDATYYLVNRAIHAEMILEEDATWKLLFKEDKTDANQLKSEAAELFGDAAEQADGWLLFRQFSRDEATDQVIIATTTDLLSRMDTWRKQHEYFYYSEDDIKQTLQAYKSQMQVEYGEYQSCNIRKNVFVHSFTCKKFSLVADCVLSRNGSVRILLYTDTRLEEETRGLLDSRLIWGKDRDTFDGYNCVWAEFSREDATPEAVGAVLTDLVTRMQKFQKHHKPKD